MTLFNQIVPRLSRAIARREDNAAASTAPEFTLKPVYELKENAEAWGLTVYLPGVAKDGLELSAEDGILSIRGRRGWAKPEGWTPLYRETVDAPYALSLEHDNSVDVDKIHAELKDGVLRVSLPKAEAVKPRKIAVN
ncbi:Hsp20/alpha crystallin family protein [Oleiharenicola sp. Vm1]|uniref:Hsp20/alpha crystallin family protein n=1 Tax=Oleiharenicola sp. Vm1 TaxID=3398393 RepID=UPI0039F5356A